MNAKPLLIPDVEALVRKFSNPPPRLHSLYGRFCKRMDDDAAFRQDHIFLPALLGEQRALAEAKAIVWALAQDPLTLAGRQSPSSTCDAQESLDSHIWCVAPRAMRLAVYFTWLDAHDVWTPDERTVVGTALLDFFDHYVVPVLRARTPGGHNQQFSMTFCSAVTGHAFAEVDGMGARAQALRDWALPKFKQTLGLMPASGYSGEGSTYQSDVVSGLVMWAGVFLEQLGEQDIWNHHWAPNGACLADTLRMESAMGSCGGLLPPWDHYGWARIHNLAARTLWAGLSGEHALLDVAESAWDEESFIAWRDDDRLWTLLYWPEKDAPPEGGIPVDSNRQQPAAIDGNRALTPTLSGWSLPAVGAAVEHLPSKLRVMLVWDRCSGGLQGICRGQVNPNHLMIDLGGEPVTADGWEDGKGGLLVGEASLEKTRQSLSDVERELLAQQFGSFENWVRNTQHGYLGMACSMIVDGWDSYLPRYEREGFLLFEQRTKDRHTFAGEAAAYYQPAFDVTRMRRTVSVGTSGLVWIVDDVQAASAHDFTWRLWLRRGVRLTGPKRLQLDLPAGKAVTLAWSDDGREAQATVPQFPQGRGERYPWPDSGSERCDRTQNGACVRFVTCLAPEALDDLAVGETATDTWEATWTGGCEHFSQPEAIRTAPDPAPVLGKQVNETHSVCDLDEAPFALLDETDADLLNALEAPPREAWRRTGAAMQTLTMRGIAEALPRIAILLQDASQRYTVHSVAAWCLGHACYKPALEVLQRMTHIPEDNTAARARWAVDRIKASC